MFKHDDSFRQPLRSRQPLWRYLSVERLRDLVLTKELYFRRVTALEDAREGTLTHRTRDQLAAHMQKQQNLTMSQAYDAVAEYLRHQDRLYVNCWHMSDHESYLMWKAYADKGVAIVTNYERLVAAFSASPGTLTGGMVDYIDFNRDHTSFGNIFRHVIQKDLPYRDEHEFRLIFWGVDPDNHAVPRTADGARVPVDTQMLIESVVLNPLARLHDRDVEDLAVTAGIRIRQSAVPVRKPV